MTVIAVSAEPSLPREEQWDHVSVSLSGRCPNWQEMCFVKDLFWEPHETVMQLHPPSHLHVNYHPHCLHLWAPRNLFIPLPPRWMVGPVDGELIA